MNKGVLVLIAFYQKISWLKGAPSCRFHPTCSEYCKVCFKRFSFLHALWYSTLRILKCHPFNPGGVDNPPGT